MLLTLTPNVTVSYHIPVIPVPTVIPIFSSYQSFVKHTMTQIDLKHFPATYRSYREDLRSGLSFRYDSDLRTSHTNQQKANIMTTLNPAESCKVAQGKAKFVLEQAMKAQRGSKGVALLFL